MLRDLIISAGLLSRGRTIEQIQNGDFPEPTQVDGKIDAGKLTENKSMNLYALTVSINHLLKTNDDSLASVK